VTDDTPNPALVDAVGEHSHPQKTSLMMIVVTVVLGLMCVTVFGLSIHFRGRQNMTDAHNASTAAALASLQAKFDRLDNGICGLIAAAGKPLPPSIRAFQKANCPTP
jgi:hypothetical protein